MTGKKITVGWCAKISLFFYRLIIYFSGLGFHMGKLKRGKLEVLFLKKIYKNYLVKAWIFFSWRNSTGKIYLALKVKLIILVYLYLKKNFGNLI